jgi:hypothetical protein
MRGDFARERDFQALLPDTSSLDLNNPANEHLLYLKSRGPAVRDRDVFLLTGLDFSIPFSEDGFPYTNYVKFSHALRMKLLMIRDLKPHLFTEPIPLSEDYIKASDLYKSILAAEYGNVPTVSSSSVVTTTNDLRYSRDDEVFIYEYMCVCVRVCIYIYTYTYIYIYT